MAKEYTYQRIADEFKVSIVSVHNRKNKLNIEGPLDQAKYEKIREDYFKNPSIDNNTNSQEMKNLKILNDELILENKNLKNSLEELQKSIQKKDEEILNLKQENAQEKKAQNSYQNELENLKNKIMLLVVPEGIAEKMKFAEDELEKIKKRLEGFLSNLE